MIAATAAATTPAVVLRGLSFTHSRAPARKASDIKTSLKINFINAPNLKGASGKFEARKKLCQRREIRAFPFQTYPMAFAYSREPHN